MGLIKNLIIFVLIIVVISSGAYYFLHNKKADPNNKGEYIRSYYYNLVMSQEHLSENDKALIIKSLLEKENYILPILITENMNGISSRQLSSLIEKNNANIIVKEILKIGTKGLFDNSINYDNIPDSKILAGLAIHDIFSRTDLTSKEKEDAAKIIINLKDEDLTSNSEYFLSKSIKDISHENIIKIIDTKKISAD